METFAEHYESMRRTILKCMPGADMELIDQAVCYAKEQHEGQKRKDGSPYIIHPWRWRRLWRKWAWTPTPFWERCSTIALKTPPSTHDEIAKRFGPVVAELVEGVTKLTRVEYSTLEEQQMENLRKMFMAMSKDIRVILIKIADRLHNTRTMQFQSPAKQISKSMETMDIYAPLAHRLGMQKIKWELEDTSLKYLDPDGYNEIVDYLHAHEGRGYGLYEEHSVPHHHPPVCGGHSRSIYGRIKHVYSIYRKMKDQNKTMEELYDLYAFRVIVDTIPRLLQRFWVTSMICLTWFLDGLKTISPPPSPICTRASIPRSSAPRAFPSRCKSAPGRCTKRRNTALRLTGNTSRAAPAVETKKSFEWVRRLLEEPAGYGRGGLCPLSEGGHVQRRGVCVYPSGQCDQPPPPALRPLIFAYAIHSGVGNSMGGGQKSTTELRGLTPCSTTVTLWRSSPPKPPRAPAGIG